MGLDMYLMKKVTNYDKVAYWEKVKMIHDWFSEHSPKGELDNCEEMVVTKELLEELLDTCEKVKANHSLAKKLLPTNSRFFLYNTDYNESYFDEIDKTIDVIKEILATNDFEDGSELVYYGWW